MPATPRVHLLIPTHVTRHLGPSLASVALQTRPPDSVTLTTDGHGADGSIAELVGEVWPRVASAIRRRSLASPPMVHVARDHQGEPRLNQVRNNGLRAIERCFGALDQDLVLVLDGDSVLGPSSVAQHAALAARGVELVIPYRYELDPAQTRAVTVDRVLASGDGAPWLGQLPTAAQRRELGRRHARYALQWAGRWLGLGEAGLLKAHKPKTLGGHHSVSVRALRAVNGYDEQFKGFGFDDDDLSRRLHALRPRVRACVAVRSIGAYHLHHETRRPYGVTEGPDYKRFRKARDVRAVQGWANPSPQPEPSVRWVSA